MIRHDKHELCQRTPLRSARLLARSPEPGDRLCPAITERGPALTVSGLARAPTRPLRRTAAGGASVFKPRTAQTSSALRTTRSTICSSRREPWHGQIRPALRGHGSAVKCGSAGAKGGRRGRRGIRRGQEARAGGRSLRSCCRSAGRIGRRTQECATATRAAAHRGTVGLALSRPRAMAGRVGAGGR